MKRKTLNLIASLFFLFLVAGGYYFIWNSARSASSDTATTAAPSYIPVEVSTIKDQAQKLIQARENNAGLPIPSPTEKLGKPKPFNDPE